ncbi:hypothetical protein [Streptomyces sp. JJ36]|uniref:hypothetical protein n=1 Tax=Streptomyces sp. JJ36 TaxID=2736645 RepID=UPI001F435568|nr:hypothetical protein [Streptomyces sp. JJ36]MCF6522469.1 hypothetical protein [Streptomyces sp. JJ36]
MHRPLRDRPAHPDGPRADCTADSAGGLTFDIVLPGLGERWDAALLLRERGAGAPGVPDDGCVRLPLFPAVSPAGSPAAGRLRAALPSTMTLAEGHWDGFLVLGEEEPRRLRSGEHDLRSLGDREPGPHRAWLGVRIPYAGPGGGLSLRAWLRRPHAEAREVRATDAGLALGGRLYGAEPAAGAVVEARPRPAPDGAPAPAPLTAAVTASGADFRATLSVPYPVGTGEWDLWLRPAPEAPAVRLARLLDDVVDRHRLPPLPPHRCGDRLVTPYWTCDNDLAVRITAADAPGGGRAARER